MSHATSRLPAAFTAVLLCGALGGCGLNPPPEHQSAEARKAAEHHELRDAIEHKTEREKAEHAADPVLEADKKHDQAIEDAGG